MSGFDALKDDAFRPCSHLKRTVSTESEGLDFLNDSYASDKTLVDSQ